MSLLEWTRQRAFVVGQIARPSIGAALRDGLLLADAHKHLGELDLHGRDDLRAKVERQYWNEDIKAA